MYEIEKKLAKPEQAESSGVSPMVQFRLWATLAPHPSNTLSWDSAGRTQKSLTSNGNAYNWELDSDGAKINCYTHELGEMGERFDFQDRGTYHGAGFSVNGYAARKFTLKANPTASSPGLTVEIYDRKSDNQVLRMIIKKDTSASGGRRLDASIPEPDETNNNRLRVSVFDRLHHSLRQRPGAGLSRVPPASSASV